MTIKSITQKFTTGLYELGQGIVRVVSVPVNGVKYCARAAGTAVSSCVTAGLPRAVYFEDYEIFENKTEKEVFDFMNKKSGEIFDSRSLFSRSYEFVTGRSWVKSEFFLIKKNRDQGGVCYDLHIRHSMDNIQPGLDFLDKKEAFTLIVMIFCSYIGRLLVGPLLLSCLSFCLCHFSLILFPSLLFLGGIIHASLVVLRVSSIVSILLSILVNGLLIEFLVSFFWIKSRLKGLQSYCKEHCVRNQPNRLDYSDTISMSMNKIMRTLDRGQILKNLSFTSQGSRNPFLSLDARAAKAFFDAEKARKQAMKQGFEAVNPELLDDLLNIIGGYM